MSVTIEVCIDNIESLNTAISAGAHRIELCSALALGGLTPTAGYARLAIAQSSIPVYPIIRHRAGDFVFNNDEIDIMVNDIKQMKEFGAAGVVVGALTEEGDIDAIALKKFMAAADGIGVTFHRAFDLCRHPEQALEILIAHQCNRILTSGQQATAEAGKEKIKALIKLANNRISIMPGAGVNASNAQRLIEETGAKEIHLSGKTKRPGKMKFKTAATMGSNDAEDSFIDVTDFSKVNSVVNLLTSK